MEEAWRQKKIGKEILAIFQKGEQQAQSGPWAVDSMECLGAVLGGRNDVRWVVNESWDSTEIPAHFHLKRRWNDGTTHQERNHTCLKTKSRSSIPVHCVWGTCGLCSPHLRLQIIVQEPLVEKYTEPTRSKRTGWRQWAEKKEEVIQTRPAEEHHLRHGQEESLQSKLPMRWGERAEHAVMGATDYKGGNGFTRREVKWGRDTADPTPDALTTPVQENNVGALSGSQTWACIRIIRRFLQTHTGGLTPRISNSLVTRWCWCH